MKITEIKKMDSQDKEFYSKEWQQSNIAHFGKSVDWTENDFILRAYEEGIVLGLLEVSIQGGITWIKDLIVGSSFRGQGIGKKLMSTLEEKAKALGSHKMFLMTGKNWPAEKFYVSLGFKRVCVLEKHHFEVDHIIMSKFL
jgi:GNAT superfamily N-acetyltransferase